MNKKQWIVVGIAVFGAFVLLKLIEGGIWYNVNRPCTYTVLATRNSPNNQFSVQSALKKCPGKEGQVRLYLYKLNSNTRKILLNTSAYYKNNHGVIFNPTPLGVKWQYNDKLVIYYPKGLRLNEGNSTYEGVSYSYKNFNPE